MRTSEAVGPRPVFSSFIPNKDFCIVVGDKFSAFCQKPNIFTFSNLTAKLIHQEVFFKKYVIGQGVNVAQLKKLEAILINSPETPEIEFIEKISKRIPSEIVHKSKKENVMITFPKQIGEKEFMAWLAIDEDCAELHDHVTGKHIPGTLLVEAARQMIISSLYVYCDQVDLPGILQKIEMNYISYLFPVDVNINLTFNEVTWNPGKSTSTCSAQISFAQFDRIACTATCGGYTLPFSTMNAIENRQFIKIMNLFN